METISWADFEKVELRARTIVAVDDFPEAKKPVYKLFIDLGEFGVKKSSARIVDLYTKEQLLGRQVLCVINFPKKKIGPFESEVLTTGFYRENGNVVLAMTEQSVPNGAKLG